MRPDDRISVGTTARWHFRLAAGLFAAGAVGELVAQAVRGTPGAGRLGWTGLLLLAAWLVGLAWRERVGITRAWVCLVWVGLSSLVITMLAVRNGFLFGRLSFPAQALPTVGFVPVDVPLLWWVVVGGGYLVVEGLWGEMRAGVSAFTAVIATLLGLMLLPFVGDVRDYWRWPGARVGAAQFPGAFPGVPWSVLAGWFTLALGLGLGLVILGDNWSTTEARSRRQAWVPAAVLLGLAAVCLSANLLAHLWLAVGFSAANAMVFGAVLVWYQRERGSRQ